MTCPDCAKKIDRVVIDSECWQTCTVDDSGQVTEYGIPTVDKTLRAFCPDCGGIITHAIKE
jgi:hypothetical protein